MLFTHLGPVDIDGLCKDIRIQLRVFYLAVVFGESFGRQSFYLAFAAFISPDIPTLRILPFVDPNFFHDIQSIVIPKIEIKRKMGPKIVQNRAKNGDMRRIYLKISSYNSIVYKRL